VSVRTAFAGALLAAVGCASGGERSTPTSTITTRDSAGIAIVENATLPAGGGWTIDTAAVVRIGDDASNPNDPHYQFNRVVGLARMRNGDVVVADAGSTEVRVFDSAGRFDRLALRNGEGPGELYDLSRLFHTPDDSSDALGGEQSALAVFGPDLKPVRKVQPIEYRPDSLRRTYSYPGIRAVFDDGSVLGMSKVAYDRKRGAAEQDGTVRSGTDSVFYSRGVTAPAGRQLAEYGWLIEGRNHHRIFAGGARLHFDAFDANTFMATRGDRLFFVDGLRTEVRVYAGDGRLERLYRAATTPVPVSSGDIQSVFGRGASLTLNGRKVDLPPVDPSIYPPHHPAADRLLVDFDGNAWVRHRVASDTGKQHEWLVFDTAGVVTQRVPDTSGMTVNEIGRDYMLGTTRDLDGVEIIVLRRLVKPSR
jgi:hypothetical protein